MIILLLVGGSGHPKPPVYGHSELGLDCAAPVDDRRSLAAAARIGCKRFYRCTCIHLLCKYLFKDKMNGRFWSGKGFWKWMCKGCKFRLTEWDSVNDEWVYEFNESLRMNHLKKYLSWSWPSNLNEEKVNQLLKTCPINSYQKNHNQLKVNCGIQTAGGGGICLLS